MGLVNKYPYTDFHDVNLDYVIKLCRETQGLHLEVSGNNLLMKSADGTVVSSVDVSHAQQADLAALATRATTADAATTAINANYATTAGSAATADSATNAAHAATADTALTASAATNAANAENANYAATAGSASTAATAARATYAETTGNVEHAAYAFENVATNGLKTRFTRGNGSTVDIEIPFAIKADKDAQNNTISTSYVANVVDDNGTLKFLNALGQVIVSITPSSTSAETDSYGNTIANYIKALVVSDNNNYVTVNHGDGTTDSILIPYSITAWKDTNGNIIKNSYVKRLAVEVDPNDGKRKLVAYNGDNPEAEIFRIELNCYSSQVSDYASRAAVADLAIKANEATRAATAATSDDNYYIIKLEPSSPSTPDDLVLVSITDKAGNTIDPLEVDMTLMLNSYIELHHTNYTPVWSDYYKIVEISNPGGNPETAPIFFRAITRLAFTSTTDNLGREFTSVDMGYISFGILNGVSIGGDISEETIINKPDYDMILISGSTDIDSLSVNGNDTYTTNVMYSDLEDDLTNGKAAYDIKIGDYPDNDYTAHLSYNRGDVEFFLWDKTNNVYKRFVITAGQDDDKIVITRTF